MSADIKIGAELSVNAGNSIKTTQSLKDELKAASKELNNAAIGSKQYEEASKKVESAQKSLKTSTSEGGGAFEILKSKISSTVPALGSAGEAGASFGTMLKALAANPLVLVLTAIVFVCKALYDAFANTFSGGQKIEQIFSGIKAVGQVLKDNITNLLGVFVKLATLDFSGALKDLKAVGKAAADAYSVMNKLTADAQKLHQEHLANDLDQANRQKRLAILREQATDETIPIAKRKAALLDLKKDAEENSRDDIALAKKITDNKIAQLSLGLDGAKKNQDEINKLKIEQIKVETENAGELRRINKSVIQADKQEKAEANQAAKEAKEKDKEERTRLVEFTNNLAKLKRENELLILKDGYDKEKKTLENKLAEEKQSFSLALKDKKLKQSEYNALILETEKNFQLSLNALNEKDKKDKELKEKEFQKELATIKKDILIASITDLREKELSSIKSEYAEKSKAVLLNEKYNETQKQLLITALKKENDLKLSAADKKFALEDRLKENKERRETLKTELDFEIAKGVNKLSLQKSYLESSRALEREELVLKKATAQELLNFDTQTSIAKIALSKAEKEQKITDAQTVSGALSSLSQLAGEQTVVGKALAIGSAVINTYLGATKALAQGGIFGAIAAAGVIASGLSTVKKIVEVKLPASSGGGGGSTPSVPSASAVSPLMPKSPQQQSSTLDQKSVNAIGNATSKAFVVATDITGKQEQIKQLNRQARI